MTEKPLPRYEWRPLEKLKPYAANSRTHSPEQVTLIAEAIRTFGYTNPVLVDASGTILAGHARVEAVKRLGWTEVPVLELDELDEDQARAYVIADNRLAEKGAGWNIQTLAEEMKSLPAELLDFTGFDDKERRKIFVDAAKADYQTQGSDDEDDVPDRVEYPVTEPGDVWEIGPHRLICGDSLDGDALDVVLDGEQVHLILCDPPYAVFGSATGIASDITDDKVVLPYFRRLVQVAAERLPWFAHFYAFCDWRTWPSIALAAKSVPYMEPKNVIVWDKGGAGLGSSYANTHEFVGFFAKLPPQKAMSKRETGQRLIHKPNIFRHNRVTGKQREHNAQKPVALLRDLIENSSGPGDLVLDTFAGSGSTLIAAHQADRICALADVEAKWCDVIVLRAATTLGLEATCNGLTYDELKQERQSRAKGKPAPNAPKAKAAGKAKKKPAAKKKAASKKKPAKKKSGETVH